MLCFDKLTREHNNKNTFQTFHFLGFILKIYVKLCTNQSDKCSGLCHKYIHSCIYDTSIKCNYDLLQHSIIKNKIYCCGSCADVPPDVSSDAT